MRRVKGCGHVDYILIYILIVWHSAVVNLFDLALTYELLDDVVGGADDIIIDGTGLVLRVHLLGLLVFLVFYGDSGFLLEAVDYRFIDVFTVV